MKVNCKATKEFDIDKVICDIDVRYYVDCSFSKDNGETWENDFEDDDKSDEYVKSQLPCMKEVTYTKRGIWSGIETTQTRQDWCPVIDVNEGKILDWTPGFCLNTGFKVCDQGVYVYSNQDESQQIVSTDCDEYYVPNWLDDVGDGYGDYLQITVNGDGTIKDWDKLKKKLHNYVEKYLDFDKVKSNVNITDYI
jgi:hypothetical protein